MNDYQQGALEALDYAVAVLSEARGKQHALRQLQQIRAQLSRGISLDFRDRLQRLVHRPLLE